MGRHDRQDINKLRNRSAGKGDDVDTTDPRSGIKDHRGEQNDRITDTRGWKGMHRKGGPRDASRTDRG